MGIVGAALQLPMEYLCRTLWTPPPYAPMGLGSLGAAGDACCKSSSTPQSQAKSRLGSLLPPFVTGSRRLWRDVCGVCPRGELEAPTSVHPLDWKFGGPQAPILFTDVQGSSRLWSLAPRSMALALALAFLPSPLLIACCM